MPRPTKQMQSNARRALQLRSESPRSRQGMTPVGLKRANQFAQGQNVSMAIVKRTYSFLSRAKAYYQPGKNTPGTQAYLGWGGSAGLSWARKYLKRSGK